MSNKIILLIILIFMFLLFSGLIIYLQYQLDEQAKTINEHSMEFYNVKTAIGRLEILLDEKYQQ